MSGQGGASRSRASFWIGLAVGGIVTAAIMFSIWYVPRRGIAFGQTPLPFTVVFEEARGLAVGSPVLASGVEVGEVTSVQLAEVPGIGWRVLVGVEVFDGATYGPVLTRGSRYEARQDGLLGAMTLAITPGGAGDAVSRGMLVDGSVPIGLSDIVEDLGHVSRRLSDFTDGREAGDPSLRRMLNELQATLQNLRRFSDKLPD